MNTGEAKAVAKIIRSRLQHYINDLSKKLGFPVSQSQISKATGIRQATISEWASGKELGYVSSKVLIKLADYFQLENPFELLVAEEVNNDDTS